MTHRRTLPFLPAILLTLLAGCSNSQTFTTARTIEPATSQSSFGVEVFLLRDPRCATDSLTRCAGYPIPWPSWVYRMGLTRAIELGGRVSASGTLGGDLKLQLLRTAPLDLAIDPGITIAGGTIHFVMPALVSFNFGQVMTFTFIPKASYMVPVFEFVSGFAEDGLLVGGGLNVQIRFTDHFALTPTFEWQRRVYSPSGGPDYDLFIVGLAVTTGVLPDYEPPPKQDAPSHRSEVAPPSSAAPPAEGTGDGFTDDAPPPPPSGYWGEPAR